MVRQAQIQHTTSFNLFINSLQSEATRKMYSIWLTDFMKYLEISEYDDLLKLTPLEIQNHIIDYVMNMRNKQLSSSTISGRTSAVKHFYEMNDIVGINWPKINKFKGETTQPAEDRPYARQEIKQLFDSAVSLRDKAIILLMASAGIRRGGIVDLRLKDLQHIPKYDIYKITVYAKTPQQYYTFCTPETKKAIDNYINWRSRLGEKINENSILFRVEFDIREHYEIRNHIRKLKPSSIYSIVRDLSHELGLKEVQHITEDIKLGKVRSQVMTCHGMRKFFDSTCTSNGMDKLYIEYCMGHDIGLKGSYYKPQWQEVLEGNNRMRGYSSIINDLTINEENRLRKQLTDQDRTIIAELAEQRKQNESLQKRMKIMEGYMRLYSNPEFGPELKKGVIKSQTKPSN
jgi:site-specific recombinase XerD